MTRLLLLSASLLAAPLAALAQTPAPGTPAPASQLDRIEQRLNEVLRRLDQLDAARSATTQAGPGVIPSPSPGAPPAASPQAYKPGALAIARAASKDPKGLAEVPADAVGGFVYDGGSLPFTDIATRGVRYAGPVGVEIQGWLKAKEAGRYQLATDLTARLPAVLPRLRPASCKRGSKAAASISAPRSSPAPGVRKRPPRSSWAPNCSRGFIVCGFGRSVPPRPALPPPLSFFSRPLPS